MNKHEHLKHKIHNFVEKLSLFKAMQKIKEYEEKLIKKSCEACEHYSEEDCGNCSYPDYIFLKKNIIAVIADIVQMMDFTIVLFQYVQHTENGYQRIEKMKNILK